MSSVMAAIRDPKTGKVYTGESHSSIIDEMEYDHPALFARLRKVYVAEGSLPVSDHVGFIGDDAVLLSRSAAQKRWGVYYSQDIRKRSIK